MAPLGSGGRWYEYFSGDSVDITNTREKMAFLPGEYRIYTTKKIDPIKQEEEAHKRAWNYIEALDDQYFTVLHVMTSLSGSLILALAFVEGDISPEEIFAASYLEELYKGRLYNEELHGASPEEEAEREEFKRDAAAARQFIDLANEI